MHVDATELMRILTKHTAMEDHLGNLQVELQTKKDELQSRRDSWGQQVYGGRTPQYIESTVVAQARGESNQLHQKVDSLSMEVAKTTRATAGHPPSNKAVTLVSDAVTVRVGFFLNTQVGREHRNANPLPTPVNITKLLEHNCLEELVVPGDGHCQYSRRRSDASRSFSAYGGAGARQSLRVGIVR